MSDSRTYCRLCGKDKIFLHDGVCMVCLPKAYDAAVDRSITAKFAVGVLRDALLAYMEPAGDTPEEIRKKARFALAAARRALPED